MVFFLVLGYTRICSEWFHIVPSIETWSLLKYILSHVISLLVTWSSHDHHVTSRWWYVRCTLIPHYHVICTAEQWDQGAKRMELFWPLSYDRLVSVLIFPMAAIWWDRMTDQIRTLLSPLRPCVFTFCVPGLFITLFILIFILLLILILIIKKILSPFSFFSSLYLLLLFLLLILLTKYQACE